MKPGLVIAGIALATATIAANAAIGGGQAPPNQAAPPVTTGLVLGEVVDVVTGKPIPEATVTVTMRGGGPGQPAGRAGNVAPRGAGPAAPQRLLTGADGRFVLHDLPRGPIAISAIAAGYVQANAGQARPLGPSRSLELDDGERVTDLKIRLWKHAVVTGTGLAENGEPAVGLTVRMLRQAMVNGKPQYQPGTMARTDDRGIYRISAITPGTFMMAVPQTVTTMPTAAIDAAMQSIAGSMPQMSGMMELMGAGAPAPNVGGSGRRIGDVMVASQLGALPPGAGDRVFVYQNLFFPSGATSAQGSAITLGPGEERSGVDFQLRVLPAVRIAGTLTGPSGPMSGVQVRLVPGGGLDYASEAGIETATTTSAGDGTFQLLGVPSGQYTLRVTRPASPPMPAAMMNNPLMQFAGSGMSPGGQPVPLFASMPVSVGATDVTGIALVLAEGAKVTGRLEFAGAAAVPQPNMIRTITLASADGRPVGAVNGFGAPQSPVDQNMQFKTVGYPPGRYLLDLVTVPPPWSLKSVTIGGRDVTEEGFELKDTDLGDVIVTFGDKASSLTGNVRTPAGAASATATVIAFPADYQSWIANGMSARRSRTAVATKKGVFTMAGLPPGDYLVAALDDADLADPRDPAVINAVARVATKLTLSEGDRKTQDLQLVKAAAR
jgi:hypothetical protein